LRRKPDAVNLALANREPQTQAVMSRPTMTDVRQEARHSPFGFGKQGTLGAGSHEQGGCGRRCAGSQTQSIWLWQAGNRRRKRLISGRLWHTSAQEDKHNQVGSGTQGSAGACSHDQTGKGIRCVESQTQSSSLWQAGNRRRKQSYVGWQGQISAQEARRSQVSCGR
jgi:hypothetical protein